HALGSRLPQYLKCEAPDLAHEIRIENVYVDTNKAAGAQSGADGIRERRAFGRDGLDCTRTGRPVVAKGAFAFDRDRFKSVFEEGCIGASDLTKGAGVTIYSGHYYDPWN